MVLGREGGRDWRDWRDWREGGKIILYNYTDGRPLTNDY